MTGGVVSATANVTGGNILTAGLISATSTITSAANVAGANITTTGGTFTGTLTTTGDALVAGNLVVQGNITYINIDDLRVEDPVIILGTGPNGAPLTVNDGKDRGVFMEYFITAGNTLANAFMGYDNSTGNMFLATNVTMANDVVTVVTFGTLQAGNLNIESAVSSGNITAGNLLTGGLISATGNITGGNINTAGNVTATTFIGNILGNIDAGGANTNIQFNDSDILAGSAGFTFDKTSNAVVANGNITGSNFNTAGLVTATGNVTGGNFLTGGLISATGNIITDEKTILLSSTANAAAANLSGIKVGNSSGNIAEWVYNSAEFHWQTGNQGIFTGANVTANNVRANGLITATGNITGANLSLTSGTLDGPSTGRITINGSNIDTDVAVNGNTLANVFYIDAGTGTASFGASTQVTNAIVNFATTTSIKTPVGNTAQRPAVGVTGMLRFNTTTNALEIYDNTQWDSVGVPVFTVIDDEQFAGDGSTVAFTLGSTQTTNSCIVSINGVVQVPTVAYSVSGTDPTCVLTFTEAPISGDLIDVRQITTTTTVTQIVNTSGNALVAVTDTAAQVNITGNLVPSANVTFDLGTANLRWNELYLAGNTIVLGNTVIKNTSGNSIGFFGPDGTTPATIDAASVDTTTIANGTSNVKVVSANGNVTTNVNGTSNVMVISSTGAFITGVNSVSGNVTGGNVLTAGLISATGNITGSFILGNGSQLTGIDATSIQSGTSNVRVVSSGGNVTTGIGGTSNVVVVATTGQFVTGVNSVSGNVTGGNILTAGDISATGNITGNNITGTLTTGVQTNITSVGTLGSLTVSGNLTSGGIAMSTANATIGNLFVTGTTTISGNITQVSGNTGQFFGNASTGFNALYAGLAAGFTILPQSVVNFVTQSNSYSQVNNQNQSAGAEATVDLVLTGDNGNDSTFFFDIGYTGSGYDPAVAVLNNALGNVVTPNDAYMYTTGNVAGGNPSHMVIGTVDTGSYVRFFVGGYYANATVMQLNAPNAANTVTITGGLTVGTGNVSCGNIINTNANGVGNIGSTGTRFNQVFALASSAQYADLAEKYTADATYATGTVVAFGGAEEVTISAVDSDRRVAGVISALPSFRMNDGLQSEHTAMVALTGRVPTMVTGTVRKGDMMVSAGAGRARAEANPAIGTVIGKALADHDGADGVIEVVVGRV